jgi:uncharacterized OsmC-like protein
MQTKTTGKVVNGVDVDKLFETINAVKESPVIAKFRFGVDNEWIDGGHNRTTITGYYGACEDMEHATTFVLDADEPPILLGEDKGPNPVEYLLKALAGCVTSALVYHAAAKGIEIEEVECAVQGEIDLQGFLGIRDDVRNGYQNIRMMYKIKADVSDEELNDLVNLGPTFSPTFDSVSRGVPITVTAERKVA